MRIPLFIIILFTLYLSIKPDSVYASEYEGKTITSIEVESKLGITSEEISGMTGIKEGDLYSTRAIRLGLEQIFKKGIFKDVIVEAIPHEGGVKLRYRLIEKVFVAQLTVKGSRVISTKKIREIIKLRIGEEFTDLKLYESREELLSFYRKSGYFQTRIEIEAIPVKDNKVEVVVNIKEGSVARISRIRFTGNRVISDVFLFAIIKSKMAGNFRGDILEEDIKRIERYYSQEGYIKAMVGPPQTEYNDKTNDVGIAIPIVPGIKIEADFKGNLHFTDRELKGHLLIYEEREYDEITLEESAKKIRDFYQGEGYYWVKVEYSILDIPEDNKVKITFQIVEGKKAYLSEIRFDGNKYFSKKRLSKEVETKPRGLFSKGIIMKGILERDIKRILSLYRENGFLDIKVMEPEITFDKSMTRLFLKIIINEGIQTFIDRIEIEGNTLFDSDTLLREVGLREKNIYNEVRVNEGRYRILTSYAQKGYIYAQVDLSKELDKEKGLIRLRYTIKEDSPAVMGRVYLQGNESTRDMVILRELSVKQGDIYNLEEILKSQRRIYRLGLFSRVIFEPVNPGEKEYVKDMMLQVSERKAGAVEFGIGYSDYEKLRGFVEVSHRNLWGEGRHGSARFEESTVERKYTLNFKEPWLFNRSIDARLSIVDQLEKKISYKLKRFGGSAGLEKSFTETIKGSILYQYEDIKPFDVLPGAILTTEDQDRVTVATINPSIVIDTRDDPFNPNSGSLNGITYREAAKVLGSEAQFVKVSLQSSWYFPIIPRIVLALSMRGGIAQNFGESVDVPIYERFFLGGRTTVRGYPQDSLGPKGPDGTPTGGNAMVVVNGEFRFSLPWHLGVVLFMDGGNVWERKEDTDLSEMKYTTGIGIRYGTPIGPLRLDYGYKLDREVGESEAEWHFTLGHAF